MLVFLFSTISISLILLKWQLAKRYSNDFLIKNNWLFQENIYGDNINYLNARSIWTKGMRTRYGSEVYYPN
jgi:hypothetical protein